MHPQTSLHDGQSFAEGFLRTENLTSQLSHRGIRKAVEEAKFEDSDLTHMNNQSAAKRYPQPVVTVVRPASTVPHSEQTTPLVSHKGNSKLDKGRKSRQSRLSQKSR